MNINMNTALPRAFGAVESFSNGANFVVTNTGAFSDFSKFVLGVISFVGTLINQGLINASDALTVASKFEPSLKTFNDLTGAVGIFQRVYDFANKKERQKLVDAPVRLASRVVLAAGQTFSAINFLHKISVINVGALASNTVGNLPVISLVTNSLVTTATALSVIDNAMTVKKSADKVNEYAQRQIDFVFAQDDVNDEKYDLNKIEGHENEFTAQKRARYEVKRVNANAAKRKAVFGLVADIVKIAIIAFSSIAAIFALANPMGLLLLAGLGLVAGATGFAKTMYGEFYCKQQPLPEVTFKYAPAAA